MSSLGLRIVKVSHDVLEEKEEGRELVGLRFEERRFSPAVDFALGAKGGWERLGEASWASWAIPAAKFCAGQAGQLLRSNSIKRGGISRTDLLL